MLVACVGNWRTGFHGLERVVWQQSGQTRYCGQCIQLQFSPVLRYTPLDLGCGLDDGNSTGSPVRLAGHYRIGGIVTHRFGGRLVRLQNPLVREQGTGNPGGGSQHWLSQRYSALIFLLLTPWLLWLGVSLAGADYEMASITMSSPSIAAFVIFLAGIMLYHAQLGLQVVIEDYVHIAALESALQLLVRFGCLVAFLISTLAALKLVLA